MTRHDKAPLGDGALPELITGAVGDTDAVAAWDYTTILPQSGCPRCASLAPTVSVPVPRPALSAWSVASAAVGCAGSPGRAHRRRRGYGDDASNHSRAFDRSSRLRCPWLVREPAP